MWIEGLSCFGLFGWGTEALLSAFTGDALLAERADDTRVKDYIPARALRQCDHFSRMALLGAYTALEDAGLGTSELRNCGLILSSGYGPAMPTFDFLDSVLDFGENLASPLAFSHSVHIIPAALIAKNLGLVGPCASVCQFESSVTSGLLLARSWLNEGRVDRVLFGAVDEVTPTLHRILRDLPDELSLRPQMEEHPIPLGEGAVFLCLSGEQGRASERIEALSLESLPAGDTTAPGTEAVADVLFVSGTSSKSFVGRSTFGGSNAYGAVPIAQAFDCAAAVSLLRAGFLNARTAQCEMVSGGTFGSITLFSERT